MTPAPLHVGTARLMLDPSGVLAWPARRLLVVADLHLEKGSAFAARGAGLLPPYDTRETLLRLRLALRRWRPSRLIALGDSFHDREGARRLGHDDASLLERLLDGVQTVWILGNHDPAAPANLPGMSAQEWREEGVVFRHAARPGRIEGVEVSGHFHPKATMPTRAGGVTRPCFVTDGRRVILPAFGAYTGGLDAGDPAIAALLPRGGRAFLLGRDRCYALPLTPRRPAQGRLA